MDCSPQAPLSMGFSRKEYWSGLSFPSPRDLPNPGIKPRFPALQADALPSELLGKPVSNTCTKLRVCKFVCFYAIKSHIHIHINIISYPITLHLHYHIVYIDIYAQMNLSIERKKSD